MSREGKVASIVRVWKGLRFAEVPRRFAAPIVLPLESLPEQGGAFGDAPMQVPPVWAPLGADVSEDCLTLNISSPEGKNLPVLVWVFGGGFEAGAASMFDGEVLARDAGCIVVTINYRVGAFGFSVLSPYGGALSDANNLGVRDLLAALEWIHVNIHLFGGDPARLTLAGQSAGAFLACAAAVASPAPQIRALALFSGGASRVVPEDIAHEMGEALIGELGLTHDATRIIDIDASHILAAQTRVIAGDIGERNSRRPRALGVAIDATSANPAVPRHPLELIAEGALSHVAILVAATTDEVFGFPPQMLGEPDRGCLEAEITAATDNADDARRLLEHYAGDSRARFLTDYIYRVPAARLADAQHNAGGRAWLLEISRSGDAPAGHGHDVAALFGSGGDERSHAIAGVYRQLIRDGEVHADSSLPIVAGDPLADDVVPTARLLDLWSGVQRP